MSLYRQAGIEFEPVDQQQTFVARNRVLLKTGLAYKVSDLLFKSLNPETRRLLGSINNFRNVATEALKSGATKSLTFGQYIDSLSLQKFSPDLLSGFLLPALTSTVFTCPQNDLLQYPCETVLHALKSIADEESPLMRTSKGSRSAATQLLSEVESIHFDSKVQRVASSDDSASVFIGDRELLFDHVVVATQANHASALVKESIPDISKLLESFRYVNVPVVVHTDSAVMPNERKDWGTFNFDAHDEAATCTVWMNRFHSNWPETGDVFHSIFPSSDSINTAKVIFSAIMQRPVVNLETAGLLNELSEYHRVHRRVWFVGSWAASGVPLLESAVVSSQNVVQRLTSMRQNAFS